MKGGTIAEERGVERCCCSSVVTKDPVREIRFSPPVDPEEGKDFSLRKVWFPLSTSSIMGVEGTETLELGLVFSWFLVFCAKWEV